MKVPLQIVFEGVERSDALEGNIRDRVGKLEQFSDRLISCHVAVQAKHHRQRSGTLYHVRINAAIPEKVLVVSHGHEDNLAHEDVYIAIRDAFSAMTRQVEDSVRQQRGDVKAHSKPTLKNEDSSESPPVPE